MSFLSEYTLFAVPAFSGATRAPQLEQALEKAGISRITCFDFSETLRCWALGTADGQAVFLRHDQAEALVFKEPDSGPAISLKTFDEFAVVGFGQGTLLVWDMKQLRKNRIFQIKDACLHTVCPVGLSKQQFLCFISCGAQKNFLFKSNLGLLRSSEKVLPVLKETEGMLLQDCSISAGKRVVLSSGGLYYYDFEFTKETSQLLAKLSLPINKGEKAEFAPSFELVPSDLTAVRTTGYATEAEILLVDCGRLVHLRLIGELGSSSLEFVLQRCFNFAQPLLDFRIQGSNHFTYVSQDSMALCCFDLSTNLSPNSFRAESIIEMYKTDLVGAIGMRHTRYSMKTLSSKWIFLLTAEGKIIRHKMLSSQAAAKKLLLENQIKPLLGLLLRLKWKQENRFLESESTISDLSGLLLDALPTMEVSVESLGLILEYFFVTDCLSTAWSTLGSIKLDILLEAVANQIEQKHLSELPDDVLEGLCELWTRSRPLQLSSLDMELCQLEFEKNDRDKTIAIFYEHSLYSSLIKVLLSGETPDYLVCLNLLLQKANKLPLLELRNWKQTEWTSILDILEYSLVSGDSLDGPQKLLLADLNSHVRPLLCHRDEETVLIWLESATILESLLRIDPISILILYASYLLKCNPDPIPAKIGLIRRAVATLESDLESAALSTEQRSMYQAAWSTFCILVKTFIKNRKFHLGNTPDEQEMYQEITRPRMETHIANFLWLVSQQIVPVTDSKRQLVDEYVNKLLPEMSDEFLHRFSSTNNEFPSSTATSLVLVGSFDSAIDVTLLLSKALIPARIADLRELLGPQGSRRSEFELRLRNRSLQLARMFADNLHILLDDIFLGQERELAASLSSNPEIHLQLLDRVHQRYPQDAELQEAYFAELCRHRPGSCLAYTAHNLLPSDALLRVSRQHDRHDCMVAEYLRIGRVRDAAESLTLYFGAVVGAAANGAPHDEEPNRFADAQMLFFQENAKEVLTRASSVGEVDTFVRMVLFLREKAPQLLAGEKSDLRLTIMEIIAAEYLAGTPANDYSGILADLFNWYPESVKGWRVIQSIENWRQASLISCQFDENVITKKKNYTAAGCGLRGRRRCFKCEKRLVSNPELCIITRPAIERFPKIHWQYPIGEAETYDLSCYDTIKHPLKNLNKAKGGESNDTTAGEDDEDFFEALEELDKLEDTNQTHNLLEIADLKIERYNKELANLL